MKSVIVIGGGYWGQNYIRELGNRLIYVVEPDKIRAEYIRQRFGCNVYPNIIEPFMFDGAVIATPPDSHVDIAENIAESGRKVLIEKPPATSMKELYRLYPVRDRCMFSNIYLHNTAIRDLAKVVSENYFSLDHIFFRRTNDGPVRNWQNAMFDLAYHDIAISNFFMKASPISASVSGNRNYAMVSLEYMDNKRSEIYASWIGGPKTRTIELALSDNKDRVVFDDVSTVLEISPLRMMLDSFLSGKWNYGTFDEAYEILKVLEELNKTLHPMDRGVENVS